jgi:membrane protein
MLRRITTAVSRAIEDVNRHRTLQMAAALSYYFVLSLFPALILLSAALAFLPSFGLLGEILAFAARFLPPDSVRLLSHLLTDIFAANRGTFLSLGMLGTLWAVSGGFNAAIEALDVAYDVQDRGIWKTRALSLWLAVIVGSIAMLAMPLMLMGPRFGRFLAQHIDVPPPFVFLWPVLHWIIASVLAVLAVETLYFLAPNVKQRFRATLPGAILTVSCWIGLTYLLGLYIRHFGMFNKMYGTLGGAIALLTWLYWTSFVMLLGAELNSELAKSSPQGRLQQKGPDDSEEWNQAA